MIFCVPLPEILASGIHGSVIPLQFLCATLSSTSFNDFCKSEIWDMLLFPVWILSQARQKPVPLVAHRLAFSAWGTELEIGLLPFNYAISGRMPKNFLPFEAFSFLAILLVTVDLYDRHQQCGRDGSDLGVQPLPSWASSTSPRVRWPQSSCRSGRRKSLTSVHSLYSCSQSKTIPRYSSAVTRCGWAMWRPLTDTTMWCWRMWKRCGLRYPRVARARSPSKSARPTTFLRCFCTGTHHGPVEPAHHWQVGVSSPPSELASQSCKDLPFETGIKILCFS